MRPRISLLLFTRVYALIMDNPHRDPYQALACFSPYEYNKYALI
jgi:hypothetical protein